MCTIFHMQCRATASPVPIYKWENGKAIIPDAEESDKINLMDMFALEINEATRLIEDGVASPDDIETGVKYGQGYSMLLERV